MRLTREPVVIFFISLLLVIPVFWITRNEYFRLDTDYDQYIPVYSYITDYLRSRWSLPTWNPYVGTGIGVVSDPTTGILNPLLTLPLLFFGMNWGLRIAVWLSILGAGLGQWYLLGVLRISRTVRVWAALLYMLSGAVVARIAAGHLEQIWSAALLPLFLALALKPRHALTSIGLGLIWAGFILIGDFYRAFHMGIFYLVIVFWRLVKLRAIYEEMKSAGLVLLAFFVISFVKLIPFARDVAPNLVRFFPIDPYAGSIHAFFTPLAWVIPWQVNFYDRPTIRQLLGFSYNWYEYYAFVTPITLIFLFANRKFWQQPVVRLLSILFVTGSLYVALRFPYSPFFWILKVFPDLGVFRTNQRMFLSLTPVVIALCALGAQWWWQKFESRRATLIGMLATSFAWVYLVSSYTLRNTFEIPRVSEDRVATTLRKLDSGNYFAAVSACCLQKSLVEARIPIINYYYGWRMTRTPNFVNVSVSGFDYEKLRTVRPRYVITGKSENLEQWDYQLYFTDEKISVWRTEKENIQPSLQESEIFRLYSG